MITLWHCDNARSTRSLWLLHELGLEFRLETLAFDMKALREPAFREASPLGRVPALRDGDLTLFESGAICQYLCETYDPNARLHRPPGHRERAEWLQWLHYAETVAVHGATLVQQKMFVPAEERSEFLRLLETRRLAKALDVIDAQLGDGREFLLASGFSAVDTAVGYSVHLARVVSDLARDGAVGAYYERLADRDAFRRAAARAD